MLSFEPETIQQLKARYPKAIERGWLGAVEQSDRPGLHREHVFDFPDGVRLIISRDLMGTKSVVHFSGSVNEATYIGPTDQKHGMQLMVNHMHEVSGAKSMKFIAYSTGGIPHWIIID